MNVEVCVVPKYMTDRLIKVKSHNRHFSIRLVKAYPKIITLAGWKSKIFEIGNEILLRNHAS